MLFAIHWLNYCSICLWNFFHIFRFSKKKNTKNLMGLHSKYLILKTFHCHCFVQSYCIFRRYQRSSDLIPLLSINFTFALQPTMGLLVASHRHCSNFIHIQNAHKLRSIFSSAFHKILGHSYLINYLVISITKTTLFLSFRCFFFFF